MSRKVASAPTRTKITANGPIIAESEAEEPEAEERWHPYHSDPTADIILRSTDGFLFPASSWRLERAGQGLTTGHRRLPNSSVLHDMLEDLAQSGDELLDIDASSSILDTFLDLANVTPPYLPATDFRSTALHLDLSEQLDCEAILSQILGRLYQLDDQPMGAPYPGAT